MKPRRLMLWVAMGATLMQASCARLACELQWRTKMESRFKPAQGADAFTRLHIMDGREALKQDFMDGCLGR